MKLFSVLLAVLALAISVSATNPPTSSVADANYEWSEELAFGTGATGSATLPDTQGASDSTLLLVKYHFETGYEYALVRGPLAGTGADSAAQAIRFDYYDKNKVFLYSTTIDTITTAAGGSTILPVNRTGFAPYCSIVLKTITGHGTQIIWPASKTYIMKRRAVSRPKNWQ